MVQSADTCMEQEPVEHCGRAVENAALPCNQTHNGYQKDAGRHVPARCVAAAMGGAARLLLCSDYIEQDRRHRNVTPWHGVWYTPVLRLKPNVQLRRASRQRINATSV